MATTTSAIDTWMNAFADALALRSNLSGVLIATGEIAIEDKDAIILGTVIEGEQDWATLGNLRRTELFRIHGMIWTRRPAKGDTAIRVARARAFALLAEVEDELRLRPTVTASNKLSALTRYTVEQGVYGSDGRWCQIDFVVSNWKELPS